MFADVADSTSLYEQLGDIEAQFTISQCLGIIRDLVERNKGKVLKSAGDDIMCMFDRADQAITASCQAQEALSEEMVFDDITVSVHIGVHSGLGLMTEGDVFGDTVNVAARVTSAAKARQILTTADTISRLGADYEIAARPYDKVQVKGRMEPVEIYDILWQGAGDVTGVITGLGESTIPLMGNNELRLRNCGLEFTLKPEAKRFVIGRDLNCNLTVNGTMVSREHAVIEYRRNKFVLRDQSTNGTYLQPTNGKPFYIRREEVPLTGEGQISLGKTVDDKPALNIYYKFQ